MRTNWTSLPLSLANSRFSSHFKCILFISKSIESNAFKLKCILCHALIKTFPKFFSVLPSLYLNLCTFPGLFKPFIPKVKCKWKIISLSHFSKHFPSICVGKWISIVLQNKWAKFDGICAVENPYRFRLPNGLAHTWNRLLIHTYWLCTYTFMKRAQTTNFPSDRIIKGSSHPHK